MSLVSSTPHRSWEVPGLQRLRFQLTPFPVFMLIPHSLAISSRANQTDLGLVAPLINLLGTGLAIGCDDG
jgi:hypothetical protein